MNEIGAWKLTWYRGGVYEDSAKVEVTFRGTEAEKDSYVARNADKKSSVWTERVR